ncbi:MAG: lipopolysaccharide biosynthesis protein [Prevotellaceae bacterium]|jgi:O-antigen/teichoic acid export membrane protein|nr:lipopolysaccharide biosynthesis protein [Prevotellaceae bacterium]
MDSPRENNKRIAKNTAMLYLRMLLTMIVALYTSRLILAALGVADLGIYDLVGGVVLLFNILTDAMGAATQRFLNYSLGKDDIDDMRRIFSMSMTVHISIAIVVLILSETVGLWMVNTLLDIPSYRMIAANWVYQFSILSICIQIIRIPYVASIIAYERMSFYAYIGIAEVLLKLLIVFLLLADRNFDRLILYSILMTATMLLLSYAYKLYCNRYLNTCRYQLFWDKTLYKKLLSFSGWSMMGSAANVSVQQGGNILLNLFYGVSLNGAMGVGNRLATAIYGFASNFQMAFNPSIVKYYAAGDRDAFINLIFRTSRYSYYLLFIIILPVFLCCHFLMDLWLESVPAYASSFCQLILIYQLINATAAPLWISAQATGQIRNYQILVSSLILLNLPLIYLVLYLGWSPISLVAVNIVVNLIVFFARLFYLGHHISLPVRRYLYQVLGRIFIITVISIPLPWFIHEHLEGWTALLATTFTSLVCTSSAIYFLGMDIGERTAVLSHIKKRLDPFYQKYDRDKR